MTRMQSHASLHVARIIIIILLLLLLYRNWKGMREIRVGVMRKTWGEERRECQTRIDKIENHKNHTSQKLTSIMYIGTKFYYKVTNIVLLQCIFIARWRDVTRSLSVIVWTRDRRSGVYSYLSRTEAQHDHWRTTNHLIR